jgi:hypothetical protein
MSDVEGVIGHNRLHSQIFEIDHGSPEGYGLDRNSIGNMQASNVDASHEMVSRMGLKASYLQESHSCHGMSWQALGSHAGCRSYSGEQVEEVEGRQGLGVGQNHPVVVIHMELVLNHTDLAGQRVLPRRRSGHFHACIYYSSGEQGRRYRIGHSVILAQLGKWQTYREMLRNHLCDHLCQDCLHSPAIVAFGVVECCTQRSEAAIGLVCSWVIDTPGVVSVHDLEWRMVVDMLAADCHRFEEVELQ